MRGSNWHDTTIGDVTILTSYDTIVACHVAGEGFFKTDTYYSRTTTKHINQWVRMNGGNVDNMKVVKDISCHGHVTITPLTT